MSMMDRYSVKQGMYNLFSQKVSIKDWADIPVFAHEFCHHIHNSTTIIAGERLNLFTQILVQMINLCASYKSLKVPFNAWHEYMLRLNPISKDRKEERLKDRLNELWEHQKIWGYLDKINYEKKKIVELEEIEKLTDFLAIVDEPDFDSKTPYILFQSEKEILAYPIGFFHIMESGAFALELWYKQIDDKSIINRYMDETPEYVIILYYVSQYISDFKTSCLFTFLLCDLALCTSTPALGFLLLAYNIPETISKDFSVKQCVKWYEDVYREYMPDIRENFQKELNVAIEIRKQITKRNIEIDNAYRMMFEYLLSMIEKGFTHIELEDRKQLLHQLLNIKRRNDMEALMRLYPMTVLEINKEDWFILDEKYTMVYDFLGAVNNLYLGLCRNFNVILSDDEINKHFKKKAENTYIVNIQEDGGKTNVYGYLFHIFGLNNKTIEILSTINDKSIIKNIPKPK
jgi:hypothetical protein